VWAYASVVDNRTGDPVTVPVLTVPPVAKTAPSGGPAGAGRATLRADGHASLIPAVAHNAGVDQSQWRTDVVVVNPNPSAVTVELVFDEGAVDHRTSRTLPAGGTREWRNVVETVFGLDDAAEAQGTVRIAAPAPVLATARTYNQSADGTYGQYLPAVDATGVLGPGEQGLVPLLRRDDAWRSNLGALNVGDTTTCGLTVRLYGPGGGQVGGEPILWVPPGGWLQRNDILRAAGAGDRALVYAVVEPDAACGGIWAYGSVVDNGSGDPTTIPVVPR
jgi:hypothetical protein